MHLSQAPSSQILSPFPLVFNVKASDTQGDGQLEEKCAFFAAGWTIPEMGDTRQQHPSLMLRALPQLWQDKQREHSAALLTYYHKTETRRLQDQTYTFVICNTSVNPRGGDRRSSRIEKIVGRASF